MVLYFDVAIPLAARLEDKMQMVEVKRLVYKMVASESSWKNFPRKQGWCWWLGGREHLTWGQGGQAGNKQACLSSSTMPPPSLPPDLLLGSIIT